MRHEPLLIGRIARKAATNLVVDAAGGHSLAGVQNHVDRFLIVKTHSIAEEKRRMTRRRKLGRGAKPAMDSVIAVLEFAAGVAQSCIRQDDRVGILALREFLQTAMEFIRGAHQLVAALLPGFCDLLKDLEKTG